MVQKLILQFKESHYQTPSVHCMSIHTSTYSQPLRHKRMGKGVHFMFEVVSRLKFSGKHDPAGRFLKKGAQSAFSGRAPILGVEIRFSVSCGLFW